LFNRFLQLYDFKVVFQASTPFFHHFIFFPSAPKLTIVISDTGITFGVLKKVVPANNHIIFASGSVAATATFSSVIITTTTTRQGLYISI